MFRSGPLSIALGGAAMLLVALLPARAADSKAAAVGNLVFQDNFTGPLNHAVWDPFICSNGPGGSYSGVPWAMQASQGVPSSAVDKPGGNNADYDLPSLVHTGAPGGGLALEDRRGSGAAGYTWSGAVICSYPNNQYFKTKGLTFDSAYVEVRAKMPNDLLAGGWPAIWFMPAPGSKGGEIDLFEGGGTMKGVSSDRVMATTLHNPDVSVKAQVLYDSGVSLSAGYHTYSLAYKSGKFIKCYFDGKLVGSWTKDVFTGSYYMIICNTMTTGLTKDWRNQISDLTPSPNEMLIKYVKVYNLP